MKMKINLLLVTIITLLFLGSCTNNSEKTSNQNELKDSLTAFLNSYTDSFQKIYYESSQAEWELQTHIEKGDTTRSAAAQEVSKRFSAFTGSSYVINTAKFFLDKKDKFTNLEVKQLESILYAAANNPQISKDIVEKRIKAESLQTELLYGHQFTINGKSVSPNTIDNILFTSKNINERLTAWESSKEVGRKLKDGLENLRGLRNNTVQSLGYKDYFDYQVSEYGVSSEEMVEMCKGFLKEIYPLYRELHTYARYELAKQYNVKEVPDYLPAHWLPNRWGQDWSNMIDVEGVDINKALADKTPEWVVKKGEDFYVSLGMQKLPESFYTKSSLYPYPDDSVVKKNTHASAWHLDLKNDVRSLMSVQNNADWFETVNHELGHIYYYLAYSKPEVPILLRGGANRAFHEAFGTMIGLAATQPTYLAGQNLIDDKVKFDTLKLLLKRALNDIVFMPFSCGVMTEFEYELYSKNLPKDEYNKKWWELVKKYQGIEPPTSRGEEFCDAATKTHINDDAAQYYDYALSYITLFQFHNHISKEILKQDPRFTNYYGNKEVGDYLTNIMSLGATKDWREVLKEYTGSEMSAKSILEYFSPLMEYLKNVNKDRKYTLSESF